MKLIMCVATLLIMLIPGGCYAAETPASENNNVNIYFVRHGKTLLNTFDRVQGWIDSPLTEEGIRVAGLLGDNLKQMRFDDFYVSDAGRHRETMTVMLKHAGVKDYRLKELTELREAFFGGFEGDYNSNMAAAAAKKLCLKDSDALYQAMKTAALPAQDIIDAIASADEKGLAENAAQIKKRTQAALRTITDDAVKQGKHNILVVSSGTAMQMMIADMTDNPDKNKPISNGAVVKIIFSDGKFNVTEVGTLRYIAPQ